MSTTSSTLPPPPPAPVPRFDSIPPPSSTSTRTSTHQRNDSQSTTTTTTNPIQDALSRDFPQVASLSREDMQLLLEDSDYFDAYFHTKLPQVLQLDQAVELQIQQNLNLAQKSQELKPLLEELRLETKNLFNEAKELQQRSQFLSQAQRETYRKFSQDSQLNRYRAATTLQDHLSESMLQSLLDGQFNTTSISPGEVSSLDQQFIRQYKEIRKIYYKRSMGLKKWEEGKVVWET